MLLCNLQINLENKSLYITFSVLKMFQCFASMLCKKIIIIICIVDVERGFQRFLFGLKASVFSFALWLSKTKLFNSILHKKLEGQNAYLRPVIKAAAALVLLPTTSTKKAEHILAKCWFLCRPLGESEQVTFIDNAFATGDGWWDSEWICECNRRAIEGDSREVVSPAGCRDHPEELKHRRCFIWSGCSRSRSFMSQVFLFPSPLPPPPPPPTWAYISSLFKHPLPGLCLKAWCPISWIYFLSLCNHWNQRHQSQTIKRGQYLKSHLRGSAPLAMQSSQFSSSETCNMLHLKYLFCFPFFFGATKRANADEMSRLFHDSIHSTGAYYWFGLLKKAFLTAKSNWTAVTPNKALMEPF